MPLLAVLAAAPSPAADGSSEPVRILYPADRSVVPTDAWLVVATPVATRSLTASLDGKPLLLRRRPFADTWVLPGKLKGTAELVGDRAQAAVWCAPLRVGAGVHTVTVGSRRLSLRGGKSAGTPPRGWTQLHAHPTISQMDPSCAGCHDMAGGTLGAAPTPKACACHGETDVQLIHKHVAEPLAKCAMCHDPHGTARPKLLVDAKEKLCSKCHALGHSKG